MIRSFVSGSAALVLLASGGYAKERFAPTWESVGVKNDAPGWLQDAKFGYVTEDIRFTRSKDRKTIYAIFMGPPKAGIPITCMKVVNPNALKQHK